MILKLIYFSQHLLLNFVTTSYGRFPHKMFVIPTKIWFRSYYSMYIVEGPCVKKINSSIFIHNNSIYDNCSYGQTHPVHLCYFLCWLHFDSPERFEIVLSLMKVKEGAFQQNFLPAKKYKALTLF